MLSIFTKKEVKKIQFCICIAKQRYEHELKEREKEKDSWIKARMLDEYYESINYLEDQIKVLNNIINKIDKCIKENNIF